MGSLTLLGALAAVAVPALAAVPGSIEVTCDVDRTSFRKAAASCQHGGLVVTRFIPSTTLIAAIGLE